MHSTILSNICSYMFISLYQSISSPLNPSIGPSIHLPLHLSQVCNDQLSYLSVYPSLLIPFHTLETHKETQKYIHTHTCIDFYLFCWTLDTVFTKPRSLGTSLFHQAASAHCEVAGSQSATATICCGAVLTGELSFESRPMCHIFMSAQTLILSSNWAMQAACTREVK